MIPRRVFIAGSTGAVGRSVVQLADSSGVAFVPHVRPRSEAKRGRPDAAVFELADEDALAAALTGCTTVLQLIGTMRKRFSTGDTYETSDIGTTRQLVQAARRVGSIDHFVLLSSIGAGRPRGAYLKAKAEAERIVRDSGLPYTTFRPSMFVGGGHPAVPGAETVTRVLGLVRLRPIRVEQLASTLLHVAVARAPIGVVLEGASLWEQVAAAGAT